MLNSHEFVYPVLDYASGFGGKFGVQNDRQDKSALGWEHIEKVEKHDSQKGMYRYLFKRDSAGAL